MYVLLVESMFIEVRSCLEVSKKLTEETVASTFKHV